MYFEDRPEIQKSKCMVVDEKGKPCAHLVAGKNATNLKSHLQARHAEEFKKLMENKKEKKTTVKRKLDEKSKFAIILSQL